MTNNIDIINAAVTLIIKAALLATRFSGRARKRSLKRLSRMDADEKDKEILFLRDTVDQLKMQITILQKKHTNKRYTLREKLFILCETLSYYHFPREHWRQIRTNNPLERIMREIRRRSRVVGYFPDGNSALMLAAARLRYIAGTKWGSRRYLNMKRLQELETERTVLSDKKSACPSGQAVA